MIALTVYLAGFALVWVFAARMIVRYGVFNLTASPADRAFSILLGLVAGWLWPLVVPILLVGAGVYRVAFGGKAAAVATQAQAAEALDNA
jgi:hypothetical protein